MKKKIFTPSEDLGLAMDDSVQTLHAFANPDYPISTDFFQMSQLSMQTIRWHWHDELEVIIVDSGIACIQTEAFTITLNAGEGIFLNRNMLHSICAEEDQDCTLYSLRFHPRFLFGSTNDSISKKYLEPVLSSSSFRYLKLDNTLPVYVNLLDLVKQIITCNIERPIGYELEVKGYLCQLWHKIITNISSFPIPNYEESVSALDSQRVKIAIRYMEQHYSEFITLEDIASYIHLSKSECCRCFKRTLGITPFEYLLKYRIFISARKIQQKDPDADTMAALALAVGFNGASYYNKVFKKYLNCTPSEFKRRVIISENSPLEDTFLRLAPINPKTNPKT